MLLRRRGVPGTHSVSVKTVSDTHPAVTSCISSDSNQSEPLWTDFSSRQKSFPFTGRSGILLDLSPNMTPIEAFQLFVDDEILTCLTEQTNVYAQQVSQNKQDTTSPHARHLKWSPTTESEMKKFLGLHIWMGLVRMGSIPSYWSSSPLYKNNVAENTMSRNRFELLLSSFHFADNEKIARDDRFNHYWIY